MTETNHMVDDHQSLEEFQKEVEGLKDPVLAEIRLRLRHHDSLQSAAQFLADHHGSVVAHLKNQQKNHGVQKEV